MARNGWQKLVDYISSKEVGYVFNRKNLLLWANCNNLSGNTIDMYRNQLVHAGIWKRIKSGTYELQSKLPPNTTTTELFMLYKGDRLKYLEKVVSRKEREKRAAEEDARITQITETNERIVAELISRPCLDCKGSFPRRAMVFSYRQVPRKFKALSKLILKETQKFVDELEKCDVICMNCHYIRNVGTPYL